MSKKKSQSMFFIVHILLAISAIVLAFGVWQLIDADNYYNKLKNDCDQKDYSSYVKYIEVESEASKHIKEEIELYKGAMDLAMEANDYIAWGQLNEKYQQLLKMQSEDKSSSGYYDYTEADKVKEACYSRAKIEKESKVNLGKLVSIISAVFVTIFVIIEIWHFAIAKTH